ncbi:MAG: response regulator transcription factor [Chloroflexota bacterium]
MTEKHRVLVVEDEPGMVDVITMYLERDGFQVASVGDGQAALTAAAKDPPDLVILDLMLPKVDGWEVCRQLRRASTVPIIMLTARDEDVDKIVGLELGADDYVTKPFNPRELVARVRAVLRRGERPGSASAPETVRIGDLVINQSSHTAHVRDRALELTPREFALLWVLASNPNRVFERERLIEQAWGYEFPGGTRTVDMHIAQLRNKLAQADARAVKITTVPRVGYRLEPV